MVESSKVSNSKYTNLNSGTEGRTSKIVSDNTNSKIENNTPHTNSKFTDTKQSRQSKIISENNVEDKSEDYSKISEELNSENLMDAVDDILKRTMPLVAAKEKKKLTQPIIKDSLNSFNQS